MNCTKCTWIQKKTLQNEFTHLQWKQDSSCSARSTHNSSQAAFDCCYNIILNQFSQPKYWSI